MKLGAKPLLLIVEDHVHCFLGLKPVVSISELMKTVKAKSSKYINDHQLTKSRFEWQEGYGVFRIAIPKLILFINTLPIKKSIIISKPSKRNIWRF